MNFSVLISVYPDENAYYFCSALNSIWFDQNAKPREIIIVKDGVLNSGLEKVINDFTSKVECNIITIQNTINKGLAYSLNIGIKASNYNLIARMDSDDISLPERFQKQISFMESNPDIAVCSSLIEEYDNEMKDSIGIRYLPKHHNDIVKFAKKRNPISHPASVFRKSIILSVGGYPEFKKSQDYALWSLLLMNGYKMHNIQEVLLKMRTGKDFLKRRGLSYLLGEYKILKYQKKIGFISSYRYFNNLFSRSLLRLSPNSIKYYLYKNMR